MKNLLKVVGMAALGGALASAHSAFTNNASPMEIGGAAVGGALTALIALFVRPPTKAA